MADAVVSTIQIDIEANTGDTESRINRISDSLKGLGGSSTGKAAEKVRGLGSALKRVGSIVAGLFIIKGLRQVIQGLGGSFSQGVKNALAFSTGIESAGHRFSEAMNGMSGSAGLMQNQLGSAFLSLLAAIAPIVNAIIGLVTRLASALAQLFGAFTGGTWLKATKGANDLAGACGGGAAAAKEWKNQLLGFDEINRLEDSSNDGGGGGGGIGSLGDMFEDAELTGIFATIHDKIQELKDELDFTPLKNAWDELKESVQALGDTIKRGLGWAWENVLKPLAHWTIEKLAPTLIRLLAAAFDLLNAALEAVAPYAEWIWEHFLKPIAEWAGDAFITALETMTDLFHDLADLLSGELSFQEFIEQLTPLEEVVLSVAAAIGVVGLVGAISLLIETVTAAIAGIGGLSGALAVLAANPTVLVVAAIAAIIFAIIELIKHWDDIKAKATEVWNSIKDGWNEFKENLSSAWEEFSTAAKQSFEETWANIKRPFEIAIEAVKTKWEEFVTWIEGKWDAIKTWWEGLSLGSFHIPLPHLSVSGSFSINPPSVPSFSIDWYAAGGFPEDGLFMANHGELVGKFANGRTAVANNEQIIEGVSRGVFEAVSAAMGGESNGSGTRIAILNVNGREFARAIFEDGKAVANDHGISLINA